MPRKSGVKPRGVFERPKGSGILRVQHFSDGVRHREKVGRKGDASLIFREALRNGKVFSNPARLVPQRHEANGRIRYLLDDEERVLHSVILKRHAHHLPELVIAVGTGVPAAATW